jgi:cell wall-associated protease
MYKLFFLFFLLVSCNSSKTLGYIAYDKKLAKSLKINEVRNWQNLDIVSDSVPGVSLTKAYAEIIKLKKGKPIIVAVLDSYLDIEHEDLKNNVWTNRKEIANNNIDDDKNGYIDDVHGWNFLGNKKGQSTYILNTDNVRMIRLLKEKYGKDTIHFLGEKKDSLLFQKAKKQFQKSLKGYESKVADIKYMQDTYVSSKKRMREIFKRKPYSLFQLDSLFIAREANADDSLYYDMYFARELAKTNNNKAWIDLYAERVNDDRYISLNTNFYDRAIIGDNDNDLSDKNYGNPDVNKYCNKTWHSTEMSGTIAGERGNNLGIEGYGNQIKIMPLVVSPASGSNSDKDIHYAIKYAVDNGAKVINMSFGKSMPQNVNWIKEAILYADKKDVLIVVSAGNSAENLDQEFSYPNDYVDVNDKIEYVKNIIIVGGCSYNIDKSFVYSNASYGKKNVDIFAPAVDIYAPDSIRGYFLNNGSSFSAAITSGIAALVRSHYPNFSASQVKEIIMKSGISYDLEVQVPGEKEDVLKPFSELSKSGKVINAYNALLMSKEYSKRSK